MTLRKVELSLEEELLILLFWAHGKDIARTIGMEKLQAVPGLQQAIESVSCLPVAIGWDDEASRKKPKRIGSTSVGAKKH
jgi:hypothetical protein